MYCYLDQIHIKVDSDYHIPNVDLYLISEKSIWKNQVRRTGFLVYFELDFYNLILQINMGTE